MLVGRRGEALSAIARTAELHPQLARVLTWLPVVCEALTTRTYLALGDIDRAVEALMRCRDALPCAGESPYAVEVVAHLADDCRTAAEIFELSPAEHRVWDLLQERLTLQEIADRLFVSRETVKTQTASIYRKLGVKNRREALALAESAQSRPGLAGALRHLGPRDARV